VERAQSFRTSPIANTKAYRTCRHQLVVLLWEEQWRPAVAAAVVTLPDRKHDARVGRAVLPGAVCVASEGRAVFSLLSRCTKASTLAAALPPFLRRQDLLFSWEQ